MGHQAESVKSQRELHPALGTLERFAAGQASDTEAMKVVAHLLRRCPVCAAIISRSLQPLFDVDALPVYSGARWVCRR